MSVGAFTLGTDACNFDSAYPGIDMSLLTLPVQFRIPLWRDVLLALGMGDSSISSIQTKLKRPGSAVALVIESAKESLDARAPAAPSSRCCGGAASCARRSRRGRRWCRASASARTTCSSSCPTRRGRRCGESAGLVQGELLVQRRSSTAGASSPTTTG